MSSPSPTKAEMAWQERSGESWARLQTKMDRQLEPLGNLALERLRPQPGERALDVGCGTGQTLLELARRVGPTGRVTGLDIAPPMLERARQRIAELGLENVELVLGNAAHQRFSQPFDLLFSRFGVMFFEDSLAAFTHLRKQLRPGGRLGFVCWQGYDKNAWAHVLLSALEPIVPHVPRHEMLVPGNAGPFRFDDASALRRLLEAAGLHDVEAEPDERDLHIFGAMTVAEAVEHSLEIGPVSRLLADARQAEPDQAAQLALTERFREALGRAFIPYASERGVWMRGAVLVVTARA